jgi:hypothetical protein
MRQVKSATQQFMRDHGIPRLLEELGGSVLATLFSADIALISVPRSVRRHDLRSWG